MLKVGSKVKSVRYPEFGIGTIQLTKSRAFFVIWPVGVLTMHTAKNKIDWQLKQA